MNIPELIVFFKAKGNLKKYLIKNNLVSTRIGTLKIETVEFNVQRSKIQRPLFYVIKSWGKFANEN